MLRFDILSGFRRLGRRLTRFRQWTLRGIQLAIFLFSGVSAFLLRFDFAIPQLERAHLLAGLCIWVIAKILVFQLFGLDCGWWRYVSVPDLLRVAYANLAASSLGAAGILLFAPPHFPRSLYFLDFLVCFIATAGVRLAARMLFEFSRTVGPSETKRTLIYGAGDAGVSLLREIHRNSALAYDVAGFVDDNPVKTGSLIYRVKVLGTGEALPSLVKAHVIDMVLIAMPSATGREMTAILKRCQEAGVAYKTVPSFTEILESGSLVSGIRDVNVEDLLGRNPVYLDESGIREKIENKVVAVTGAAGSIGSELCRQIARFRPAAIVAYDCAETALFYIDREMRESFPGLQFYPEIGDIRNLQRLNEVFDKYRPSILYHAAAYKHVPLMEAHVFEAIENNVIGTWNVAVAAAENGIADFVMISSDKAVRPTNVMGATKRVAELLIHALQNGRTKYVSVRFGNVLGSNGSVIPLFKQQIAARKPVTVTHPEMRRYFMTIPEAAQLVIQASTMGKGGEIFVLDMGEPVRILDLANNLILLSGLRPYEDIKIVFSGIRPGEKTYEELAHLDEEMQPTFHQKIKIFANHGLPAQDTLARVEKLRNLCADRNISDMILELKDLITDYNPSSHLLRQVMIPPRELPAREPRPAIAGS
jgi:FlaA1/EpsC-like NDP-sugar epimerase